MNKDLQIGQRVRLSDDHGWQRNEFNPTNCDGIVIEPGERVKVNWDNGRCNGYDGNADDLIPVDATADSALETLV